MKSATVILLFFYCSVYSQTTPFSGSGQSGSIPTGAAFLQIAGNARAMSMGNLDIATSADAYSIYSNAAKQAFIDSKYGFALNYTPWLSNWLDDIYLANLSGYYRFDDKQAISYSARYYSLGAIIFFGPRFTGQGRPTEISADIAYSRKINDNLAAGLTARYIYSNLAIGQFVDGAPILPDDALAFDISFMGTQDIAVHDAKLRWGVVVSNLGTALRYSSTMPKYFLPANLGLGSTMTFHFSEDHKLMFGMELNKLLVPTPNTVDDNGNAIPDFNEQSVASSWLSSFGDAGGGFTEEVSELNYSFGTEYWFRDAVVLRAGHFNEHLTKGARKHLTFGLGAKVEMVNLDVSYLKSFEEREPFDNTVTVSLSVDITKS